VIRGKWLAACCWMVVVMAVVTVLGGCGSSSRVMPISAAPSVGGTVSTPTEAQLDRLDPAEISFVGPDVGFISTDGGMLERTDSGGRSWRIVGGARKLSNLDFVSSRLGFATSASACEEREESEATCVVHLLRSTDGGRRWPVAGSLGRIAQADGVAGLQFVGTESGWYSTQHEVLATIDGGRSWRKLRLACPSSLWLGGVAFLSRLDGYLLCGGQPGTGLQSKTLYATRDGGRSWHAIARAIWPPTYRRTRPAGTLPLSGYVDGIIARKGGGLMIVLGRLGVIVSHDGGHRWSPVFKSEDVWGVAWPAASRAYILLHAEGIGSLLRNRGALGSWQQIYPTAVGAPAGRPVAFTTALAGVGAGASNPSASRGQITVTTDGGETWTREGVIPGVEDVQQLVATAPDDLWATTTAIRRPASSDAVEQLWRSRDGGRSWRLVRIPRGIGFISISFPTASVGFLMSQFGLIYRTDDDGARWIRVHGNGADLRGARFLTTSEAYATTSYADGPFRLLKTTNDGRSWHSVALPRYFGAITIASLDDGRHWWISGNYCQRSILPAGGSCPGAILRTADGGRHWQLIRLPTIIGGESLSFANPRDGYADPSPQGIYRTLDGGRTWRFVTSPLY
jgi:photosystem II stability/assembly factor-like uncharacterized protein